MAIVPDPDEDPDKDVEGTTSSDGGEDDDAEVVDAQVVEDAAQRAAERAVRRVGITYGWRGPMPPPEALQAFENTLPGAAERILALAEGQVAHRQQMERDVVASGIRLEQRGQVLAFVLGFVAILGGIVLVALDKSVAGFATVITAIAGLVGVGVWSRISQAREAQSRALQPGQSLDASGDDAPPTGEVSGSP